MFNSVTSKTYLATYDMYASRSASIWSISLSPFSIFYTTCGDSFVVPGWQSWVSSTMPRPAVLYFKDMVQYSIYHMVKSCDIA